MNPQFPKWKFPEKLEADEMGHLFDCTNKNWPLAAVVGAEFSEELARRWNMHTAAIQELRDILSDDAKYPQLRLPENQRQRIGRMLQQLKPK